MESSKNIKKIDESEIKIIKELVINPKISDNQISKNTGIPLKTVNRKRKKLEEKNCINYILDIDHSFDGLNNFNATAQFIVLFRHGITRKMFFDNLSKFNFNYHNLKHIKSLDVGEFKGKLTLIFVIESRLQEDLLEIFNTEIFYRLNDIFGHNCIDDTKVIYLSKNIINMHNYVKGINIEKGKIKKDWPKDLIFVSE
ncbi:MAG: winged helix-turn-helix domain-containing protein [Nanoarchaeota archaeon]